MDWEHLQSEEQKFGMILSAIPSKLYLYLPLKNLDKDFEISFIRACDNVADSIIIIWIGFWHGSLRRATVNKYFDLNCNEIFQVETRPKH